ncbi:replication factor A protein 3 [Leucosporidium creatinivorum]|uniref:Replication factor A protein 3 n=1 Tax=Leucosporidium creatinivorum TaxID=106004 RepID=A0A1Y2EGA1_9BASI|nr:replication factor A protein 3 [Leucosporidium creatinivorum]
MERPTPRVNSARLQDHIGKTVRLIGKVISLEGESALLETSDSGQVTVKLSRTSNFADVYVEVIGRVSEDLSITELASINMGDKIDMDLVEKTVELTHRHPDIFPSSE